MTGWWIYDYWQTNPVALSCVVFWVIFSICLHELGHGYVAMRCGDQTPRLSGHMTLNPFVHIPPMAWIMFIIVGFTWGLMPVNPSRFRRTIDEAIVAFAGPAVNVVLAMVCIVLAASWAVSGSHIAGGVVHDNVQTFLRIGAVLNIVLFVFNLIPIPPLDGSRILATFVPDVREAFYRPQAATMGWIALIVLSRLGASDALFEMARTATASGTGALVRLLQMLIH